MAWWAAIPVVGKVIEKTANSVIAVKDAWTGHKGREKTQAHNRDMGVLAGYLSEFTSLNANRNWWDSLWDGVNRMPRPAFVSIILWYFYTAINAPIKFQLINTKLAAVPVEMWGLMSGIILFYFGNKQYKDKKKLAFPLSDNQFDSLLQNMDKIEGIRKERLELEKKMETS